MGAMYTTIGYSLTDSWIQAGAIGGVASLATAFSLWITGKAMDRSRMNMVLLVMSPGSFVPLFYGDYSLTVILLISVFAGLLRPPSGTAVRTSWQRVALDDKMRVVAYSFDASLAPLSGALGAAGAAGVFALAGPGGLLLFICLGTFIPAIMLALHPSSKERLASKNRDTSAQPLGRAVWITVAIVGASWTGLVAVEMAAGVSFGEGALLWANAIGLVAVALGAVWFSRTGDESGRNGLLLASASAAGTMALVIPSLIFLPASLWILIFTLGLFRGMISSAASTFITFASPESRRSEALALYGSSVLVGQAGYRPLAGALSATPAALPLLPGILFFLLFMMLRETKTS